MNKGVNLPLEDNSVDVIVTRLALYHFVQIEKSFEHFVHKTIAYR